MTTPSLAGEPPLPPAPPAVANVFASDAPRLLEFVGILNGIAVIVALLRIYVRRFMLRTMGADDWAMIGAMLCGIGVFVCFLRQNGNGLGHHIQGIHVDNMELMLKWTYFQNLLLVAGICLLKISLSLLLIRLFRHRAQVWFLWGLIAFLITYAIAVEFALIFQCIPINGVWNIIEMYKARCMSADMIMRLGVADSTINVAVDVLLAIFPIPIIVKMKTNRRTKAALCLIMLFGFVAVGAAGVKLQAQITFLDDIDRYYTDTYPIWAAAELYFGILAASLPLLKPLFAKLLITRSAAGKEELNRPRFVEDRPELNKPRRHDPDSLLYSKYSNIVATPDAAKVKGSSGHFAFLKMGSVGSAIRSMKTVSTIKPHSAQNKGASSAFATPPASLSASRARESEDDSRPSPFMNKDLMDKDPMDMLDVLEKQPHGGD